ncbi:MAG: hypothetical protein K9G64_07600 [Bacteroidia bacterium]|nr:hypothetical protein [Bacteroidia bacterium]
MNKAEFTNLIINPDKLGHEHIDTLKKIVADYPYFSTAQILLAKALFNTNHYEYDKQLKTTALSVSNREVLNQFLNNISSEIVAEKSVMHVSNELKAEKVSKPDFEAGKLEQEALLSEAQNILSKTEIQTTEIPLEIENLTENTPEFEEEKIEILTDNFNFTEPILENIVTEIPPIENELTIENEVEVQNNSENIPDFLEQIDENITDNFDYTEPILENIVNEIPEIETVKTEEKFDNETESNTRIDFQLAETEGILVKYVSAEVFLPDFDEASLFAEEQNIETITKSVLPNSMNSTFSIPEIEPNIDEEIENTLPISEESIIESLAANNQSEDILTDSSNLDESENNLLENILAIESEIVNIPIETNEIINFETIEEIVLATENANAAAIIEATNLNFLEWLTVNKKETIEDNAETAKPQEATYYEDAAFVAKIKQIIKSKAENDLSKNIITEIETAHDNTVPFERKSNIPDSIEETVEKIELADNILEEINIESFAEPNETILETKNDNEAFHSNEFSEEIHNYSAEVESILPDFEALKALEQEEEKSYIIYDKKEGLIPNYETPVFDPLFNSHFETKPTVTDSDENEVFVDFDNFTIDENLFENSFSAVYIPLSAKEIEKETDKLPINETINVKSSTSKTEIDNILDKFMRENPSISRPKTEFFNPASVAKNSAEEKDEIVSETLASIYLKQGLLKKSILTYEKLCLIYPHKNAYFAALINKIKTEHNIN